MISKIALRDGYGRRLSELDNPNIVVLTADLAESSRIKPFIDKYPDRFIQVGISEQDMFGIANGLGLNGKIPLTNTFASFCLRAAEQIRLICINNSNVKIIGHHAGINLGQDGVTQMCEIDMAYFRSLPNMTVVAPCDALETQKALDEIIKIVGPCYLRLAREPSNVVTNEYTSFKIGKANILRDGTDVLIVSCGLMIQESLRAAQLLEDKGIHATVMNMHTIKPLDKESLIKHALKNGCVVTAEEHSIIGGLGSAVCEALSSSKIPVKIVGINDKFGESGKADELFKKFGLTAENLVDNVIEVIKLKDKSDRKIEDVKPEVKEVDDLLREMNGKTTTNFNNESSIKNSEAPSKRSDYDPRGRIIKMSDADKAKVDGVLRNMFGGRRN